jgi:hydrogenase/urease accessory protein HupE
MPDAVFAHDPGLSSIMVKVQGEQAEAVAAFARKDVETLLLTLGAVRENETVTVAQLNQLAPKIMSLRQDGQAIQPRESHARFADQNNIEFTLVFPVGTTGTLSVGSPLIESLPRGHRQFLSVSDQTGSKLKECLLSANASVADFARAAAPVSATPSFLGFLALGVEHILTGYDHLLFLFGLLVVTQRFSSALKIISCFTIAHSITLAAATLNIVTIPSRVVEPTIAASIVYVGIENLFCGGVPRWRWVLTFAFGLIHGLGFASALRDLGVGANGSAIGIPLVSFNLGVELGQLGVTAVVLPILWKLRQHPVFVRRWVPACSVAVALAGTFWLIQRVSF